MAQPRTDLFGLSGWLRLTQQNDEDFLGLEREPEHRWDYRHTVILTEELQEVMASRWVTVRYYTAPRILTWDAATEAAIRQIVGDAEVEYTVHCSEYTGYLWTDEALAVGGHDLLEELKGHVGAYLLLEVTVHGEEEAQVE